MADSFLRGVSLFYAHPTERFSTRPFAKRIFHVLAEPVMKNRGLLSWQKSRIILDTIKIIYINKKWLSERSRNGGKDERIIL